MDFLRWRIRYTRYMHKFSCMGWRFCWDMSRESIEYYEDGYEPTAAASEEMSYWSD